jgi:hypothetical protein
LFSESQNFCWGFWKELVLNEPGRVPYIFFFFLAKREAARFCGRYTAAHLLIANDTTSSEYG